jgi:hypothetical protein
MLSHTAPLENTSKSKRNLAKITENVKYFLSFVSHGSPMDSAPYSSSFWRTAHSPNQSAVIVSKKGGRTVSIHPAIVDRRHRSSLSHHMESVPPPRTQRDRADQSPPVVTMSRAVKASKLLLFPLQRRSYRAVSPDPGPSSSPSLATDPFPSSSPSSDSQHATSATSSSLDNPTDADCATMSTTTDKAPLSPTGLGVASPSAVLCCDKCDGKHATDACPYYPKTRETHPDAQRSSKHLGGASSLPGAHLRTAKVVRQPGDGSCLFHSIRCV